MDELDSELQELLGALPDTEDDTGPTSPVAEVEPIITPAEILAPTQVIRYDEPVSTPVAASTDLRVDINEFFGRYESVTQEILEACRSDRCEAQEVIDLCRKQVMEATEAGRDPARMFVDGLVKAVEVKANINMTAVKIIDAGAKLISAGRTQINIKNNVGGVTSQELEAILSQPFEED